MTSITGTTTTTTSTEPAIGPAELADKGFKRLAMHILIFVIIIGAWELAGVFNQLNDLLLPAPSKIIVKFIDLWFISQRIWWHFFVTMYEATAGFFIGVGIGMSLAISAVVSPVFRRYISPYAIAFNVTPGIAVTPLIIAWFGFGWSSKIAQATLVCFFAPFINTLTGLLYTDEDATELFRSMRANKKQYFWKLQFPSALPLIIAGFKIALTGALIGAVVAEFFSASEGIGILMQRTSFKLDIAGSIATLISMSLMGLLFFSLMEVLDYKVLYWKRDSRMQQISKKRKAAWHM
jgi:NitT/TauT family transport system permease protein